MFMYHSAARRRCSLRFKASQLQGAEALAGLLNLPTPRMPDNDSDTDEGFLSTNKVECTLLQCLSTLDYWLLSGSVSLATGTGLAFINSASTITHSLKGTPNLTVRAKLVRARRKSPQWWLLLSRIPYLVLLLFSCSSHLPCIGCMFSRVSLEYACRE